MEKISEKTYYDVIENRIWGFAMPTALLFVEPGNDICDEWIDTFNKHVPHRKDVEIPIYLIDISECPKIAEEFHICHDRAENVKTTPPPVFVVYRTYYDNERITWDMGVDNALACLNKYELLLITLKGDKNG